MLHHRGNRRPITEIAGHRGVSAPFPSAKEEPVEQRAETLRRLLQNSGPLFSSFALYLSSRVDLLPAEYCRELALTAGLSPALSPLEVEALMVAELGSTFHRMFSKFDPLPFRASLIDQTHAAVLVNGDKVIVCLLRREFADVGATHQIVSLIREKPLHVFCPELAGEEVFTDFAFALQRASNLLLRGKAMEGRSIPPKFSKIESVSKVYRELSGKRVLTLAEIEGNVLSQLLHSSQYDLPVLARSICQIWLRDALYGSYVPVDPRPGNVVVAGTTGVAFVGNEFVELPPRTTENLCHYLFATLVDNPDTAALHLLQEMHPPRGGLKEAAEFRSSFRQAAYFGALEPVLGTDTNALAQLIFQHLKTALNFGYKPTPHLLSFYRGLFSVARVARELAPGDDPLREGLEELDADVVFEQFNDITEASYWLQSADKIAMAMINLPQTVDEGLNWGVSAELENQLGAIPEQTASGLKNPVATVVLFVAAIVFILQTGMHGWMEQSVVLALMIVGLMLLQI